MLTVRVTGERETAQAFRKLGLKVSDLRDAWGRVGIAIRNDAYASAPTLSGALVSTIRAGKSKSQAVVRAGSRAVVYAGIQNYGGMASGSYGPHWIEPTHYLNTALLANADYAESEVRAEVMRLARRTMPA